ncbi:hypothetical protein KDAU_54860 [Dictyobacter aurantiacus]|uniref:Uncharacterized protein n=2 Tax=Dictyobacter aurantiacus TaxID=1936993 RepID=A0A401ZMQ6_9CHLR|nr:hypothetical protein KDAU_54860 [Dictyobacter aurantiacus]
MGGRMEIQKEDEAILVQFVASWFVNELSKRIIAWMTTYLNTNEIYTISTTVAVDFTAVVDMMLAFVDDEGGLIDVKIATERENSLHSLFPRNGTPEILVQTDEIRRLVAQSNACEIKVLIFTGLMNVNPVLATIQLRRYSEDQTSIEITGFSKEGWMIRRHAGKKVVRSLAQKIEVQLRV